MTTSTRPETSKSTTQTWPDLTVVLMTCNRPDLAGIALAGVLAQTVLPGTVIVTDDSRDDTTEKLVAACPNPSVTYRRGPRTGQSGNLRSSLGAVKTPFVLVLHDDDRLGPELVSAARSAMATAELDVFASGMNYIDGEGNPLPSMTEVRREIRGQTLRHGINDLVDEKERIRALLISQVLSAFQGTVFRKSSLTSWFEAESRGDLEDFWINAHLAKWPVKIYYDERLLCDYRVHPDSVTIRGGKYSLETVDMFHEVAGMNEFAVLRDELAANARRKTASVAQAEMVHGSRPVARRVMRDRIGAPKSMRETVLWTGALLPVGRMLPFLAGMKARLRGR